MTSVRIKETKLIRPTMQHALCRCSGTRGFEVSQGGREETCKSVMGNWTVGGNVGFEWVIGKDKFELVDGAGAGKDAGVAVGEMMADASEGLV